MAAQSPIASSVLIFIFPFGYCFFICSSSCLRASSNFLNRVFITVAETGSDASVRPLTVTRASSAATTLAIAKADARGGTTDQGEFVFELEVHACKAWALATAAAAGGTFVKSGMSPSSIVGWVKMASRNAV